MDILNFSENIIKLRHEKKITQEQLADFIGVTKASVSKWETRQSLPDIMLLPRLAAFFDVTIDELVGYNPQLSREQIQKIYHDLTVVFAEGSFDEAMMQSRELVKKYYSCYPFLFQMAVLWLNHFMLGHNQDCQTRILTDISRLCSHIISNCGEMGICNDAVAIKATADLQMGRAQEVIEAMEDMLNPYHLYNQSDALLIQAYQCVQRKEDANRFAQISMYLHLLSLVENATQYMYLHSDNLSVCEETIDRIETVMEVYGLEELHPNAAALFCYQAALVYCIHEKKEQALAMLRRYSACANRILDENVWVLRGDDYFDQIEGWYLGSDMGGNMPRDKKIILESVIQSFDNPVFAKLHEEEEYQRMKKLLAKRGESR